MRLLIFVAAYLFVTFFILSLYFVALFHFTSALLVIIRARITALAKSFQSQINLKKGKF